MSREPAGSGSAPSGPAAHGLSNAHLLVAEAFFDLPASRGFVVAGGAALIAHGVVERFTDDLDLFVAADDDGVERAAQQLAQAARLRGWGVQTHRSSATFVRMSVVVDAHELVVDLAVDSPPLLPPTVTLLGPTIALEESAGQKLLALFGRAAPRDFVDVFELAQRFGTERLLQLAQERDSGFDSRVLADMLGALDRISDSRLPVEPDHVDRLREFYARWRSQMAP